jgi:hypothetical protein
MTEAKLSGEPADLRVCLRPLPVVDRLQSWPRLVLAASAFVQVYYCVTGYSSLYLYSDGHIRTNEHPAHELTWRPLGPYASAGWPVRGPTWQRLTEAFSTLETRAVRSATAVPGMRARTDGGWRVAGGLLLQPLAWRKNARCFCVQDPAVRAIRERLNKDFAVKIFSYFLERT